MSDVCYLKYFSLSNVSWGAYLGVLRIHPAVEVGTEHCSPLDLEGSESKSLFHVNLQTIVPGENEDSGMEDINHRRVLAEMGFHPMTRRASALGQEGVFALCLINGLLATECIEPIQIKEELTSSGRNLPGSRGGEQ